jgi:hypothetical protein
VTAERARTRPFALMLLLGSLACFPAPAATVPVALPTPDIILDTLSPGTRVRLATSHMHVAGHVLEVTTDSLRLHRTTVDTTVARAQIDTLWLQGSRSHDGTKAGVGAGLVLALLLVLAGHSGPQPEASGYGLLAAAYVVAGGLGLGILVDLATPTPWLLVGAQ